MIRNRVFVVGCPRSGTTLLQSLLAAHPEISSFPESHFFPNTVGGRWRRILGITSPEARQKFINYLEMADHKEMMGRIPERGFLVRDHVSAFVTIFDELTHRQGKSIWVEKTPAHLHFISIIEKYISDASFIHLLRNGKDVVASLYEVTQKYPESWGGPRSVEQCVRRWNVDTGITARYDGMVAHEVVKYEDLVKDPEMVLRKICIFLGVEFTPVMIEEHSRAAEPIIFEGWEWIESAKHQIKASNGKKFKRVFSLDEQDWVVEHLEPLMGHEYAGVEPP